MLNRPTRIATTGAALAVSSFGVGLFYESLPLLLWNTATAIALVIFAGICTAFMFAYAVFTIIMVAVVFAVMNPLGILIFLSFIVCRRVRNKLRS